MRFLQRFFSLPLLTKELVERAARRRTYVLRIAVALVLYLFFWLGARRVLESDQLPMFQLGAGAYLLRGLVYMLFITIYTVAPAMVCGVVTQEKERDSLSLLLLTDLRPWQIILQKFVGGMIPVLNILMLAVPLIAICYTYGGFTTGELMGTVVLLVLAAVQIGAIALWSSCRCRTTGSAFLCTYVVAALLASLPFLLLFLDRWFETEWFSSETEQWMSAYLPPVLLDSMKGRSFRADVWIGFAEISAVALIFLMLSVRALPRYAFAQPRHFFRRCFARMDGFFERLNLRFGGFRLGKPKADLPEDLPILWRETRARGLARREHLMRVLLIAAIPVVIIALAIAANEVGDKQIGEFSTLSAVVGILSVLILTVSATNCVVSERVNQTHEVLLTTPLTAREIVLQKVRALHPLWRVAGALVGVVFLTEMCTEAAWVQIRGARVVWFLDLAGGLERSLLYTSCALWIILIYPPLFTWVSVWWALRCRTRIKALIAALGTIVIWCALPLILMDAFDLDDDHKPTRFLAMLSPARMAEFNEEDKLDQLSKSRPWLPVALNAAGYGALLGAVRWHCLRKADACLRR